MSTPSFEERFGLPKKGLQINSIDQKTRVRVWNELNRVLWIGIFKEDNKPMIGLPRTGMLREYVYSLWSDQLGWNLNLLPTGVPTLLSTIEKHMLQANMPWNHFLNFIEKVLTIYLDILKSNKSGLINDSVYEKYTKGVNKIFMEESCGYRFVGVLLSPVIDEVEIQEIEDALGKTKSLSTVKGHLKGALILLSDREHPDYNNSVKESISALEALGKLIVGKPDASLTSILDQIEKKTQIHSKLKLGIKNLYDWSSDAPGVRHSNKGDGSSENFDSAKLTLVLCSGLVNYLIAKSEEAGINLQN